MDIQSIADKKELAYMLIQQQRILTSTQQNCQILEQRITQLEQAETNETLTEDTKLPTPTK